MTKRVISRASKRRLTIFGTISIIAIFYFIFSLIYNVCTLYDLSKEKSNLESLYEELQEDAETLKIDIEKFSDSKYLANYAREHYLYSKDGEYIIQIDELDKIEDGIDNEINKNHIIIALSVFMMFIFGYIIIKAIKKQEL